MSVLLWCLLVFKTYSWGWKDEHSRYQTRLGWLSLLFAGIGMKSVVVIGRN